MYLEVGATLYASLDSRAFEAAPGSALLYGDNLHDIAIEGCGTIGGQATYEWRLNDLTDYRAGRFCCVRHVRLSSPVDAGSMLTARREIDVDATEVWVTVTLVLDVPIDPVAPPTLAGTIVGSCEVNSPRWVKVVALYDRVLREQQVDHEGFFMFVDVPPGVYALFIFGGPKLCHQQTVSFRRFDKPLRIVLPSDRERPE